MGDPFDDCKTIEEVLGQLAGAASKCWTQIEGTSATADLTFDSERAAMFVQFANERIKAIILEDRAREFSGTPAQVAEVE